MSKQMVIVMMVLAVSAGSFLCSCTTPQSRRQVQRIEELERRVSKIEFDSHDSSPSDDEFSRYRNMARAAR